MTWLRLTGRDDRTILVNMDKIAFAYQLHDSGCGYRTELGTSHTGGVLVKESVEQIASMLPFSAQPVPGNYRANSDG